MAVEKCFGQNSSPWLTKMEHVKVLLQKVTQAVCSPFSPPSRADSKLTHGHAQPDDNTFWVRAVVTQLV